MDALRTDQRIIFRAFLEIILLPHNCFYPHRLS